MERDYVQTAKVFKALCDERRLRVLTEQMDMPQSSLSYHMKILCESGIVVGREEGKWTHYKICSSGSQRAIDLLKEITTAQVSAESCDKCGK